MVLTLLLLALLRQFGSPRQTILRAYGAALVVTISLGAVVELIQLATGRDASIGDLARDALGAVAAICNGSGRSRHWSISTHR